MPRKILQSLQVYLFTHVQGSGGDGLADTCSKVKKEDKRIEEKNLPVANNRINPPNSNSKDLKVFRCLSPSLVDD